MTSNYQSNITVIKKINVLSQPFDSHDGCQKDFCGLTQQTTQPFNHPHPSLVRQGENMKKVKLVGWDKYSLIGKKKKGKKHNNSDKNVQAGDAWCNCLPVPNWCSANHQEVAVSKANSIIFITHFMEWNSLLVSLSQFAGPLPAPYVSPTSSLARQCEKLRIPWCSLISCYTTTQTLVCYQQCSFPKLRTQHHTNHCEENNLFFSQNQDRALESISVG